MAQLYDEAHQRVIARVVLAIIVLAVGLYGAAIGLVVLQREVPGELWLGAGNASGALLALLANSTSRKQEAAGTTVEQPGGTVVVQAEGSVRPPDLTEEQLAGEG